MARWIPARAPRTISYLQARDYAGQDATVTGRVQYVFNNGKTVLLGFQRPHAGFFEVEIPKDAWPAFVGAGLNTRMGRDLAGLYREGQDIRVTGRIEWYQGNPAIYVRTPGQIGLTQSFAKGLRGESSGTVGRGNPYSVPFVLGTSPVRRGVDGLGWRSAWPGP